MGGLRAIFCQADKLHERKDTHRKPPLPHLRVADVVAECLVFSMFNCQATHYLLKYFCINESNFTLLMGFAI